MPGSVLSWAPPGSVFSETVTSPGRTRITAEERRAEKLRREVQIAEENAERRERLAMVTARDEKYLDDDVEQARYDVRERQLSHKMEESARLEESNREWRYRVRHRGMAEEMTLSQEAEEMRHLSLEEKMRIREEQQEEIARQNYEYAQRLANATSKLDSCLPREVEERRVSLGLHASSGQPWKERGMAPRAMPRAYLAPPPRSAWSGSPRGSHDDFRYGQRNPDHEAHYGEAWSEGEHEGEDGDAVAEEYYDEETGERRSDGEDGDEEGRSRHGSDEGADAVAPRGMKKGKKGRRAAQSDAPDDPSDWEDDPPPEKREPQPGCCACQ